MKKCTLILLSLALCFSVTACTSEDVPTKGQAEVSPNETVKEKEIFGINETAVFQDLKFTATEMKQSDGSDFFTPESGNVFVGINFTIENISDEEQSISSILLFDAYADDVKCDYSFNAACAFDGDGLDGSIAPGKKLTGWYAVEVPANWGSIELNVQSSWLSNNHATFIFTK